MENPTLPSSDGPAELLALSAQSNSALLALSRSVHDALEGELPTGFDYWREYDEAMLDCCEELHVLMLDGWRESVGVQAEIKLAELWGLKIVYVEP